MSELSLVTGLDYVDPWLVLVHRVEDEIAELVQASERRLLVSPCYANSIVV